MRTFAQMVATRAHWLALPIACLLLFPSPWMWLGFLGAPVIWGCRWIARGAPFPASVVNLPLTILLAMVAFGFAITPAPDLAIATAGQVIAGVTIFFVLTDYLDSSKHLWNIASALVLFGVALALVAPFTVSWSANKLFGLPAFYEAWWPHLAEETNPNILAGALAPIVPIALALIAQGERRQRMLGAIALAPILLILLLLQSRGAVFGLAMGLIVWLALYNRWVLPFVPFGILAILAINNAMGAVSFTNLFYGETGTGSPGTLFQRQDLWLQSLFLIRQSPVFGIGLSGYPHLAPVTWPNSPAQPGGSPNHAHNLFLQVALDTGVLGLAAFVAILVLAWRTVWSARHSQPQRHLTIALCASWVVLIVHGLGDVIVWGTAKSSIVLWVLLAMAFRIESKG